MYKIDNLQSQTLQNLASRTALGIYTKTHATFENTRLARFALQSQAAKLLPKERVKSCLRCRIDASISVGVKYNTNAKKRIILICSGAVLYGIVQFVRQLSPKKTRRN